MKLATLVHVPEPKYGNPAVLLQNLAKFPAHYPVLKYSSHPWPDVISIRNPDVLKGSRMQDGSINKFAVNNAVFLTGMRIAKQQGVTHAIYLEEDCRVGRAGWDEIMFDHFFSLGRPLIAAGTLAVYNPCAYSPECTRRWHELIRDNKRRNFPISSYGFLPAATRGPTCVFPNGAGGIYCVDWIDKLFNLDQTLNIAAITSAWDMVFGVRLFEIFKEDVYEVLGYLNCIYSGFGDIITTEEDRQKMLSSGEVCLVHQIKSAWQL